MPNISTTSLRDDARQRIEELCRNYDAELRSDKLKRYTEEDIKKGFILPLFEALGWDTKNRDEVSSEEHIKSSGRVDYGFYLDDRPKFYLEAKSAKANIYDEQWAKQAVRYSWNKGVTWAVLTNFEHLLVFNAQDIKSSLNNKRLFAISYSDFVTRFDDLWLLSKPSFADNALDAYAERIGKKFERVPISALLYKDLDECREILTRSLAAWNKEKFAKNPTLLDEGVQKLLDRLIFMRVAEDRGVEPPTLIPLVREWDASKDKSEVPLYEAMVGKFREFDATYNSNLFSKHPFETWDEYDRSTEKVIKILYGKEGYYEYDFKVMPADVLGTVYENYLGHRLSQSKKKLFNEVELNKDLKKRKDQGIYYTPTFIVDYIVEHALGPVLDKCKTSDELLKIKVLDPACGSGSFLIKALEVLNEKYKSLGYEGDEGTKLIILTHNIYGVDLDEQAVEIARLNLCINSLDRKAKLPYLTDNIKCGNSLISGTDVELKKSFGTDLRDKRPFNWQEQFPSVFAQGGFDVVIGNPPYVVLDAEDEQLAFLREAYQSSQGGKVNLYKAFIEKGILLLKNGGRLGFICPSNYLSSADSKTLRNFLLHETKLSEIIEYSEKDKVFGGVTQALTTIILEKSKKHDGSTLHLVTKKYGDATIQQDELLKNDGYEFVIENTVIEKINQQKLTFGDLCEGYQGEINVSTKKEFFAHEAKDGYLPLLRGNQVIRYYLAPSDEVCPVEIDKRGHWKNQRIVLQEVSNQQQDRRIKGVLAPTNVLCGHTTNYLFPKNNDTDIYYVLGLLNSRVVDYYFKYFNNTNHVPVGELKAIPAPTISSSVAKMIGDLAKAMLDLQFKLHAAEENSNEWERLKSEIEKTDQKIDAAVYELYGLTEDDIRAVRGV